MSKSVKWFERKFDLGLPVTMLPVVIERLRGTPALLEERLAKVPHAKLIERHGHSWSVQEHVGHLLDLEDLWLSRLEDFRTHAESLRAADLENRKTHEARHNERALSDLLMGFRARRAQFVLHLLAADEALCQTTALHPRLSQPMRLVDHAFFVAEHDDHHLAAISHLLRPE